MQSEGEGGGREGRKDERREEGRGEGREGGRGEGRRKRHASLPVPSTTHVEQLHLQVECL